MRTGTSVLGGVLAGVSLSFAAMAQEPTRVTGARPEPLPHAQGAKARSDNGDTTCVDVVDKAGNLFSATPSSGWLLGGAFVAGDTGVPMSNRMQVFDLDPSSPNVLVGGKRPRTTLTPTLVMKDANPFLAMSTPGGDSQDQQILNVLLNVVVFEMDRHAPRRGRRPSRALRLRVVSAR